MDHRSRAKILDVREQRKTATPFEFRDNGGEIVLEGYASTFQPYDVYGGVEAGGWVENLTPRAFDRTMMESPDVQLLINHEGMPLARTKSGTLVLSVDKKGLRVRALLDPEDPDVKALVPKMRRGDMDEMSFAFRVKEQEWNGDYSRRTIREVSLQKGDVSVVNYGMNPTTHAQIQGVEAVGLLAALSHKELAELRSMDAKVLDAALGHLEEARSKVSAGTNIPVAGISCIEVRGAGLVAVMANGREITLPSVEASNDSHAGGSSRRAGVAVPGKGFVRRAGEPGDDPEEKPDEAREFPPEDEEDPEKAADDGPDTEPDDDPDDEEREEDPEETPEDMPDPEGRADDEEMPPEDSEEEVAGRRARLRKLEGKPTPLTLSEGYRMLRGGAGTVNVKKAKKASA